MVGLAISTPGRVVGLGILLITYFARIGLVPTRTGTSTQGATIKTRSEVSQQTRQRIRVRRGKLEGLSSVERNNSCAWKKGVGWEECILINFHLSRLFVSRASVFVGRRWGSEKVHTRFDGTPVLNINTYEIANNSRARAKAMEGYQGHRVWEQILDLERHGDVEARTEKSSLPRATTGDRFITVACFAHRATEKFFQTRTTTSTV